MRLIADSGSTKTDWVCIGGGGARRFQTIGMSPYFVSEADIVSELEKTFPTEIKDAVTEIQFFGTGCGREESKAQIRKALQRFFTKASCTVDSDLVGAAIASFGKQSGLVSILGTGMNIGYWDGTALETPMPSLGFILGDEGSGATIGKMFLSQLFEKKLSPEIEERFSEECSGTTLPEVLDRVYKQPRPNAYLASFAPFVAKHQSDPTIRQILDTLFDDYFRTYVVPMAKKYDTNTLSLVGSIAFVFKDILAPKARKHGISIGTVLQKPLDAVQENLGKF